MNVGKNKLSKTNPLISVLVPIYNVEKYLSRCIDSVLSQDFCDYELILVDDGSPDRCSIICDEYAKKDFRVKVIHKQNGGLVSARLAGFKQARGEYLVFLDSDDWLLPKALSILYSAITQDPDIDVVRSVIKRYTEGREEWLEHYEVERDLEGKNTFFECLQNDSIAPYLHSGIYRASLFEESTFAPLIRNNISVGEDWITNYSIAPKVYKVRFIETPTFAYFLNTKSMMGGSVYGWDYERRVQKCIYEINEERGFVSISTNSLTTALHDLQFFFFKPEIPFNWKRFMQIQPVIINGLNKGLIDKEKFPAKYLMCIRYSLIFYIYTIVFRYTFLLFKLKGKKRKVLK